MTIDTDRGRRPSARHTLMTMPTADQEPPPARFLLELSPDDEQLIRSAARAADVPFDEFVREAIRAAAIDTLADRREIVVDPDEWDALSARLQQPGRRNEKIAELFARPSPFEE